MRKARAFNRTAIAVAVATVFLLSACAGGGGGGSGANNPGTSTPPTQVSPNPVYLRSEVPYAMPGRVAVVDPLVNIGDTGYKVPVADTFAADIQGTGGQDLIIAGRMTQPTTKADWGNYRMSMMGWENGILVDKTAQWFPNGINEILGTEPSVKFADFFKTGRTDMFVAPSTDMMQYGPAYVFTNQSNRFSRQSINVGNIWSHDSAIADLNNDGYKDILIMDYGTGTTMAINDQVSSFQVYKDPRGASSPLKGGSGVAVDDFLHNGQKQLIVTDTSCNVGVTGCGASSTKMFTYTLNSATNAVNYSFHSDLPTPRFELPKWSSYGFAGSHNVRAVNYDFNDDNIPDALIFSMPKPAVGQTDTKYSEIQFLKNNGTGSFTDVTDTTLVGYNTKTYTTYNPKFIDLNGDGKTDILVSGHDYTGNNNSTQFLLKSSDGKYVAAHQNILTDFATQVNTIQNTANMGNTVNLLKGPNGKLYLISAVTFMDGGDRKMGVYMSELGSQSVTTAKTAVDLILQKWPYMTVPQANEMLAKTSASYFGGKIIDLEALMSPIGSLSLPTARGAQPISGFISGVNFQGTQAILLDDMRRSFSTNLSSMNITRLNSFQTNTEHNDNYELTSHAEYLINGPVLTHSGFRIGSDARYGVSGPNSEGPDAVTRQYTNYTLGIPRIWNRGNWNFGTQYTALNQNPWFSMGGAWGQVTNSGIMDNVVTYRNGGFSTQASLMHVTTNITPGLVTNISNMTGGWAETGYRYTDASKFGDIGVYAGVKPVVFSGNIEAKMPTSVDNDGNVVYTSKKVAIQNQVTPYVRALYTNMIDKKTMYRFSVMGTQQGQYRLMHELRFWID
jgi:hypothetical protein